MRTLASLLALTCTGCFATHPLEEGSSGSRLALVAWEPVDGTGVYGEGLFDSELGVRCEHSPGPDQALRCLPWPIVRELFTDEACARPVALISRGCSERYVSAGHMLSVTASCGSPALRYEARGYQVLGPVDADRFFQIDRSGACVEAASLPTGEPFGLEALPDERFVRGEVVVGEREDGERLSYTYIQGEDGSRLQNAYRYDHERGDYCSIVGGLSGPMPCLISPWGTASVGESPCDVSFARKREARCAAEESDTFVAARYDPDGCVVTEVEVFGAGEAWAAEELGMCTPGEGTSYHRLVALPEGHVATLSNEPEGTGRIRRVSGRHPWMAPFESIGMYFDAELDVDCDPRLVGDTLRCVPARMRWTAEFADSACLEPASVEGEVSCSRYRYTEEHGCVWPMPVRVFEVGAEIAEAFERDAAGACVRRELRPGTRAHRLEPVPDETFAAFRRLP